jgi:hypothetical protein
MVNHQVDELLKSAVMRVPKPLFRKRAVLRHSSLSNSERWIFGRLSLGISPKAPIYRKSGTLDSLLRLLTPAAVMPVRWLMGFTPSPRHAGYNHVAGGSPTCRRRGLFRFRLSVALSGVLVVAFLMNNWAALMPMDRELYEWSLKGCPAKILDLTTTMQASYQVRRQQLHSF